MTSAVLLVMWSASISPDAGTPVQSPVSTPGSVWPPPRIPGEQLPPFAARVAPPARIATAGTVRSNVDPAETVTLTGPANPAGMRAVATAPAMRAVADEVTPSTGDVPPPARTITASPAHTITRTTSTTEVADGRRDRSRSCGPGG